MAGDNQEGGTSGGRPARLRPHWWAVLAVSVSLLALAAAAANRSDFAGGDRGLSAAALSTPGATAHPQSTASSTQPTTTTPATTVPTTPVNATTPTSSTTTPPPVGTTVEPHVVAARSATTTTTTTTAPSTTTTAPAGGASVAAAAVQTMTPVVDIGTLQQPDSPTAVFTFTGVGNVQVSVTSAIDTPLLLTVSCPEGGASQQGSSSVTAEVPDADGPCDLVVKEVLVQYLAVPYTVTIGPGSG